MNLYPNSNKNFEKKAFENPPREYRGAPFWAWNTKLSKKRIKEQIEILKEMGMGGFHIHSRIGLDTEYLGEEFLEDVRYCAELAEKNGMRCFLYDEDKWPSGYGGGRVTVQRKFANQFLLFSPEKKPDGFMEQKTPKQITRLPVSGEGKLLARYQVVLENGRLQNYRMLRQDEPDSCADWYAYQVTSSPSPWFNNQPYVDTLNPKAIQKFLQVTYERYENAVGGLFGKEIPSIFTDEPQFAQKDNFSFAACEEELKIPWTEAMDEIFRKREDESLLEHLPELFWELESGVSRIRYLYHDLAAELFAESYSDQIGKWCVDHGIYLTGHVMEEETLGSQTRALGEAMRQYRGFAVPGIDILADRYEYTTAKQAQSIAHQMGREGVLSELYGVTNWDFDFRRHKRQGDWQAALGVTLRVHHLSWMSMKGEAKRDYPAPLDEHSPWYRKYHLIEDYFARINTVLTRGKPDVHIAVIHPVESYWLFYGPNEQTAKRRAQMEYNFQSLTRWLLFGLLDFDFLSERMLPDQYEKSDRPGLKVGEMCYEVVIVPPLETVRSSTLNILREFSRKGGKVFWLGEKPAYIDAVGKKENYSELDFGTLIPFSEFAVGEAMKSVRQVQMIRLKDGKAADSYLSNIRLEGDDKWIFLAPGKKSEKVSVPEKQDYRIIVPGYYSAELLHPDDGKIEEFPVVWVNRQTQMEISLWEDDSILLHLSKRKKNSLESKKGKYNLAGYLRETEKFFLEEENVLLLDRGEIWLGKEKFAEGEFLKGEDKLRRKLGYSLRTDAFPQPWLQKKNSQPSVVIRMHCTISSEENIKNVSLAAETSIFWKIQWNGKTCAIRKRKWMDAAYQVFGPLEVQKGKNDLWIELPFGEKTELEWMYLTGKFGVAVQGMSGILTSFPSQITYGSLISQKLPFYGGNITYRTFLRIEKRKHIALQIPDFAGALLEVQADEREKIPVYLSPYTADLGVLEPGTHEINITCYGNRFNQFGQLHNRNHQETYYGPKTWRTQGAAWSEEYQFGPAGILSAPVIWEKEE